MVRDGRVGAGRVRCGADSRRQRLLGRVPGGTVLSQLQGGGDLRRHPRDSQSDAGGLSARVSHGSADTLRAAGDRPTLAGGIIMAGTTSHRGPLESARSADVRVKADPAPTPNMTDSDLSLEFLRVVEQAAIACAHTMGQGDRHKADQVAVEAMRRVMDTVPMDGTIVIGEGERDEAPMLYIGERVGIAHALGRGSAAGFPQVDIAVDPLEGTN